MSFLRDRGAALLDSVLLYLLGAAGSFILGAIGVKALLDPSRPDFGWAVLAVSFFLLALAYFGWRIRNDTRKRRGDRNAPKAEPPSDLTRHPTEVPPPPLAMDGPHDPKWNDLIWRMKAVLVAPYRTLVSTDGTGPLPTLLPEATKHSKDPAGWDCFLEREKALANRAFRRFCIQAREKDWYLEDKFLSKVMKEWTDEKYREFFAERLDEKTFREVEESFAATVESTVWLYNGLGRALGYTFGLRMETTPIPQDIAFRLPSIHREMRSLIGDVEKLYREMKARGESGLVVPTVYWWDSDSA